MVDKDRVLKDNVNPRLLRERRKSAKRRGRRALYDLPPGLIKTIAGLAEEGRLTNSQVAGLLLIHALTDYYKGKINLRDYRQPSDSPRYDYRIDLEQLFENWNFQKIAKE
ncbi:MAG: hypothetical protein ABIG43_03750 [Chloroflexota bacterium]